jgi:hypothetical protein
VLHPLVKGRVEKGDTSNFCKTVFGPFRQIGPVPFLSLDLSPFFLRSLYADGLGFTVDWEHRFEPGFPVFAKLTRDGLSRFLSEHAGDCKVGGAAYTVVLGFNVILRQFG